MNTSSRDATRRRIRFLTQFSILLAVEALFCFTPLGSLPAIGPIVATLMSIPVVITAVMLGPGAGSLMGFFAGLFSFLVWTFTPPNPLMAFIFSPFYMLGESVGELGFTGNFSSLFICFIPRVLVGTVAGGVYRLLSSPRGGRDVAAISAAAALGSLASTFGVMGGVWLFFGPQYEQLTGSAMLAVISLTVLTSGVPEAIVAAIAASAVCRPLKLAFARNPAN